MPTNTPNLSLATYNTTTDAASTSFLDWRTAVDGITGSNMTKIDDYVGTNNANITALQASKGVNYVAAAYASAYSYTTTSTGITSYVTNTIMSITLDVTNVGSVGLIINALATKYLLKINNATGVADNVEAGDLKAGKEYLFRYNGTGWIWINAPVANQISMPGTVGNLLSINSYNTISDSTYGINGVSGFPTLSSGSISLLQLPNHAGSTAGFGVGSQTDYGHLKTSDGITNTSGTISSKVTSPIVLSGTSPDKSIGHALSGIVAGSFSNATITVDSYGHLTAASSGSGGGGGGHVIQNSTGGSLPQETNLRFGVGFTVTDSAASSATIVTNSVISLDILQVEVFI
jgi:hypothetical protein